MVQEDGSDDDKNALQRKEYVDPAIVHTPRTWPVAAASAVGFAAVGGGGIAALIHFSKAIGDVAAAYNFIAQNGLSLFIFLAVIAQALIYFSQRNLMHRQWEAMQGQLGIMRKAQESLAIGERAYLVVEDIAFVEKGERPQIVLTLFNGGRTPAFKVNSETEASIGPPRKPPNGKLKSFGHPHGEKAIVPANTKKLMVGNFPNFTVTPSEWQTVDAKTAEFYVRGVVYYVDFQDTKRSIPFCVGYDPSLNRFREYKTEDYEKEPN